MPFGHKGHSSMNAYAALREKADPAVSAFIDAGKAAKGSSKDLFAAGDDDDDRSVGSYASSQPSLSYASSQHDANPCPLHPYTPITLHPSPLITTR